MKRLKPSSREFLCNATVRTPDDLAIIKAALSASGAKRSGHFPKSKLSIFDLLTTEAGISDQLDTQEGAHHCMVYYAMVENGEMVTKIIGLRMDDQPEPMHS